jgi:WbqC-like protein family
MKAGIMQPYILPYLGYFQLINAVDEFVVLDDVNYINRGWINRNNILLKGETHRITIPLVKAGQNRLINEIAVDQGTAWRKRLMSTIEHAYKKSPHFETTYALLGDLVYSDKQTIAALNVHAIELICGHLGITTRIHPTSSAFAKTAAGAGRIMSICRELGADEYINAIGGLDLYDREAFRRTGIRLRFIKTSPAVTYRQYGHPHVPNLSILDTLMFCDKEWIRAQLDCYELV